MLVALPEPFDFVLTTERFRAYGRDPANLWEDGRLYRVLGGREVAIEPAPGGVRIEPAVPELAGEVRRFLGASFDLEGFARRAGSDPVLAGLAGRLRGLRPPLVSDPFEALVTSITAQQVSLRAAFAIRARLIHRFGRSAGRVYAFPERGELAHASAGELAALGFSRRKAEYVLALARSELDLESLAGLPDGRVKDELTALPGIGEWTADWFLARHLGRPDAWPAGDLGLRKAVSAFYLEGRGVAAEEVRAFGERFTGHRNLAAHYLLAGLTLKPLAK